MITAEDLIPLAEITAAVGAMIKLHTNPRFVKLEATSTALQAQNHELRVQVDKLEDQVSQLRSDLSYIKGKTTQRTDR